MYGTMEKQPLFAPRAMSKTSKKIALCLPVASLAVIAFLNLTLRLFSTQAPGLSATSDDRDKILSNPASVDTKDQFDWNTITPSTDFQFYPCYNEHECARLDVPMDWSRPDGSGSRIIIAVIRLPARVPVSDPRYGGPVLINPGGPGGSGVDHCLVSGKRIQTVIDSEEDPSAPFVQRDAGAPVPLFHDIVGFDPRAIKRTTPAVTCFPDPFSREDWMLQNDAVGMLGSSPGSLDRNWYRAKALGEGCSARLLAGDNTTEKLGEHVNTTPVIRDMVEIIDKYQQWIEKHTQKSPGRTTHPKHLATAAAAAAAAQSSKEPPKLKYWGFSYGTVIGQTFASMYPSRISRLAIDGVVDAAQFYNGPWLANIHDADKIMDRFFAYCAASSPESCSFYLPGGADEIRSAYDNLLQHIRTTPIVVPSSGSRGPDVITWSDVKSLVRLGMYQPQHFFPLVANLLSSLARGNGSAFADFKQADRHKTSSCPSAACRAAGPFSDSCTALADNGPDSSLAILCTDAQGLGDVDMPAFTHYWESLRKQSAVLGDWWAHTRLGCLGWGARAKWRFAGPVGAERTSHPILWLSNSLDPVTPIANARDGVARFPGSVLVEQRAEGHCTLGRISLCTAKVVRKYFQTGELPPRDTVCEVETKPFVGDVQGGGGKEVPAEMWSAKDAELMEAWVEAGKEIVGQLAWRAWKGLV